MLAFLQVRDSAQSFLTVQVPLYVSYIYVTAPRGWASLEHHTEMEFSFFYDTVLWRTGTVSFITRPKASGQTQAQSVLYNLLPSPNCVHVAADFDWLLMNVSLLQAFRQTACCQLDYKSFGSSLEMTDDWWLSSKPMPSSEVCVFSYLFSFHCICEHNLTPNCIWTQLDI